MTMPATASSRRDADGIGARYLAVARAPGDDLPLPGSGSTWKRFRRLAAFGADDLSLARLVEGHADARAILAEAGVADRHPGTAYGVWAARSRNATLSAVPISGGWTLEGTKAFCSGSGVVERALVTADTPDGYRLFDLSVVDHVVSSDPDSWPAVGMAASSSETLRFAGFVSGSDAIGPPGFYLDRPGFWFGAMGVAACWHGGAIGLVERCIASLPDSPGEHVLAALGNAVSNIDTMRNTIERAAAAIDADPADEFGEAHRRALSVRETVHDGCTRVLERVASAGGARPLCHNRAQARAAADLYVYLAQHHGGADSAELGRLVLAKARRR
jgi:hypothetical protein